MQRNGTKLCKHEDTRTIHKGLHSKRGRKVVKNLVNHRVSVIITGMDLNKFGGCYDARRQTGLPRGIRKANGQV